jgi:hypothetical protein
LVAILLIVVSCRRIFGSNKYFAPWLRRFQASSAR